jgi:Holliday junction DNA helicase RuvB
MDSRIVDPSEKEDYSNLRPKSLGEYIGQENIKKMVDIHIKAAKKRNEPMDHVLLVGPPGLGKTTLANIMAIEMGVNIKITSGPVLDKQGDLAAMISNLERGDILFIDEIHRTNKQVQEILYPAMEDFSIDIMLGKGPSARSIRIDLEPFTLIGATTRSGLLSSPFLSRFGLILELDYYSKDELVSLIKINSHKLGVEIEKDAAEEISLRSRGTPRIANRLLKRIRDYAQVHGHKNIDKDVVNKSLEILGVDDIGLDRIDRKILKILVDNFNGGPVGLKTLASVLGEEIDTIENVFEPYLIRVGLLKRTPRGRVATQRAFNLIKGNGLW